MSHMNGVCMILLGVPRALLGVYVTLFDVPMALLSVYGARLE